MVKHLYGVISQTTPQPSPPQEPPAVPPTLVVP
jgi:hypothetical protein